MDQNFTDRKRIDDEITLARNNENGFYRILRKSQNDMNANIHTFGDKKTYQNTTIQSSKEIADQIQFFKTHPNERFKGKSDKGIKDNVSDACGFGSVRLSPPFEDEQFDKQYFEFVNDLISKEDTVADFGGGTGLFLGMFDTKEKKYLIEKNGIGDVPEYNIVYQDTDQFISSDTKYDFIFCFHTLEHLSEPESVLNTLIDRTNKVLIFASPIKELIHTSIHHYIYFDPSIVQKILKNKNVMAWFHITKNLLLDVHCMVIKDKNIFLNIKDNQFFKSYWSYFSNYHE